MKPKMALKMVIDLVMTILLLCQMAYMLIGEIAHEWMGAAMFLLFVLHHILNIRWYQNLPKGKFTALRSLQTAVNLLVFLSMLGLMVSGIMMSREVFAFLSISSGMGFARILHMLAAYWGFIFMSVHLGLHWGIILGMVRKMSGLNKTSRIRTWILRTAAVVICSFGAWTFIKNNIFDYLFVRSQFVFFDMRQPLALFFCEYIAMMGLWVCIAYYGAKVLGQISRKKYIMKRGCFYEQKTSCVFQRQWRDSQSRRTGGQGRRRGYL